MKKINLAISEFAIPAPLQGSIEALSGFGKPSVLGIEIHQAIQAIRTKENEHYQSEVLSSHTFEMDSYHFQVSGRMDGFWNQPSPHIEEIKTSFNVHELGKKLYSEPHTHPYCLQLKTYGYFYWLKTKELPKLNFYLVSTRTSETVNLPLFLDILEYELWLDRRLRELVEKVKKTEKNIKRRKKASDALEFPFKKPRQGQVELIQTIEDSISEKRPLLVQAPTGLGKTIGVLYPSLRESLRRGQKTIYITPKNSQHSVAEDALERLQETGAKVKSMTLTAKSKMCFKNEPLCNPEYCEYARDHYTKLARNNVLDELSKKKSLNAKTFRTVAGKYEICPFELQLDAAENVDSVVCDYNYVFAPRSAFGRLTNAGITNYEKPNLVIDEAHNLPFRAMDYYSPALSVGVLEKMREDLKKIPLHFCKEAENNLDSCINVIKACAPQDAHKACEIEPPIRPFMEQDEKLKSFLSSYLNSNVEIESKDPVLRLCFYWSEFTANLEFINSGKEEFFTTYNPYPPTVKITCCDASEMLRENYKDYSQVVAFSATLKPFDFYSRLSGLASEELKTAEFTSPFPKENRQVLIIPQISSKYSERERNYPKIAEAIEKIASLHQGN
ncbi:MAG: ATP-dependent DNA helicase, partial [Pseudobdellovibrionaceae bacterium]